LLATLNYKIPRNSFHITSPTIRGSLKSKLSERIIKAILIKNDLKKLFKEHLSLRNRIFSIKQSKNLIEKIMRDLKIQYVTDSDGNKKAVMIPIEEWERLGKHFEELMQYLLLKSQLKEAYSEVKEIKKGNKSKISLNDFLNEC